MGSPTTNPNDPLAAVRQNLIGVWDVYTPGMQTEVVFQANGQYTNTMAGGMQGHAGQWNVFWNGSAYVIQYTIQSHYPDQYMGTPIYWPTSEHWLISAMQPNQVWIYGGMLVRRQAGWNFSGFPGSVGIPAAPRVGPSVPAAAPQAAPGPSAPPPPPPSTFSTNADIAKMWADVHQAGLETMQRINDNTKAAYEKSNKAFLDYIKS